MNDIDITPTPLAPDLTRMTPAARLRGSAVIGIVLVLFATFSREGRDLTPMSLVRQMVAFASFAAAAFCIGWALESRRIAKGKAMSQSTRMTTVTVLGLLLAMPVEKLLGVPTGWYIAVWLACNVVLMVLMYPKHWASK